MEPTKPGGGNKPQTYIPAGNGEHSGEYTDKTINRKDEQIRNFNKVRNCKIRDRKGLFNPCKSNLVGKVNRIFVSYWGNNIPTIFKPNTVIKKIVNGVIEQERYFNEKGETYLEIHYTNHGNSKAHPRVPHIHRSKVVNGVYKHAPWEDFR